MRSRASIAVPLVAALLLLGASALVDDPAGWLAFFRIEVPVIKALAGLGCVVAVMQFRRGDYLRGAWMLAAASQFLLVANDLLTGVTARTAGGPATAGDAASLARAALLIGANAANVAAIWLFSRAVRAAGLDLLVSRRARTAAILVSAAIALGLAGRTAYLDVQAILGGSVRHIGDVGADLGDILSLILLAPLLMTAYSLRGGRLMWPFGLIAASTTCWLLYDAAGVLGGLIDLDVATLRAFEESLRLAANLYLGFAGLAQRWIIGDQHAQPGLAKQGDAPRAGALGQGGGERG